MAPAEIICISMTPGNTSAMPASASVPSFATNQVSIRPVAACATITSTLGHAIRSSVATIGPCSSARVRGVMAGAGTSSRAPTATAETSVEGCDAHALLRLRAARSAFAGTGSSAARAFCHSIDAYLRACAFGGGGPGGKRIFGGFLIGRPLRKVHHDRVHRCARLRIDQSHARALGAKWLLPQASRAITTGRKSRPHWVSTYSWRGGRSW